MGPILLPGGVGYLSVELDLAVRGSLAAWLRSAAEVAKRRTTPFWPGASEVDLETDPRWARGIYCVCVETVSPDRLKRL